MKKISLWAAQHTSVARILLIICKIAFTILSVYFAGLISSENLGSQAYITLSLLLLTLAGAYFFLIKYHRSPYSPKRIMLSIVSIAFLLTIVWVQNDKSSRLFPEVYGTIALPYSTVTHVKNYKKSLFRSLVSKAKHSFHQKISSTSKKILWIVLNIVLGFFFTAVTFGIIALSCNLSCTGYEVASILVLIFGLIGIILITAWLSRLITRNFGSQKQIERLEAKLAAKRARRLKKKTSPE